MLWSTLCTLAGVQFQHSALSLSSTRKIDSDECQFQQKILQTTTPNGTHCLLGSWLRLIRDTNDITSSQGSPLISKTGYQISSKTGHTAEKKECVPSNEPIVLVEPVWWPIAEFMRGIVGSRTDELLPGSWGNKLSTDYSATGLLLYLWPPSNIDSHIRQPWLRGHINSATGPQQRSCIIWVHRRWTLWCNKSVHCRARWVSHSAIVRHNGGLNAR